MKIKDSNLLGNLEDAILMKAEIEQKLTEKDPTYQKKSLDSFFQGLDFSKIIYTIQKRTDKDKDLLVAFSVLDIDDVKYVFFVAEDDPKTHEAKKTILKYIKGEIQLHEVPDIDLAQNGMPKEYFIQNNKIMSLEKSSK